MQLLYFSHSNGSVWTEWIIRATTTRKPSTFLETLWAPSVGWRTQGACKSSDSGVLIRNVGVPFSVSDKGGIYFEEERINYSGLPNHIHPCKNTIQDTTVIDTRGIMVREIRISFWENSSHVETRFRYAIIMKTSVRKKYGTTKHFVDLIRHKPIQALAPVHSSHNAGRGYWRAHRFRLRIRYCKTQKISLHKILHQLDAHRAASGAKDKAFSKALNEFLGQIPDYIWQRQIGMVSSLSEKTSEFYGGM